MERRLQLKYPREDILEVHVLPMKLEDVVEMYDMQIESDAFVVECDKLWEDKEIMPRPAHQHDGRHMQNIIRTLEDPLWPGIVQRLACVLKGVNSQRRRS